MLRPHMCDYFVSTYICRLMIGPRVESWNLMDKTGSLDICGYHMGRTWVALGYDVNLALFAPLNLIKTSFQWRIHSCLCHI